jgi:hypothetical protein
MGKNHRIILWATAPFLVCLCLQCGSASDYPGPQAAIDTSSVKFRQLPPAEKIELRLLTEKDRTRRAVLNGLLWAVKFAEDDESFDFVFSSYVLMLRELTLRRDDEFMSGVASELIRDAFSRLAPRLDNAFPAHNSGKWDFISILPFIYQFGVDDGPYLEFYGRQFDMDHKPAHGETFEHGLETYDYDLLGDYLIDYTFLHFLNVSSPGHGFDLPQDRFEEFVEAVSALPLIHDCESDSTDYYNQNYYVTHIVFVVTDYGQVEMKDEALKARMVDYLQGNLETVVSDVGELELMAEFIHCLNMLGYGDDEGVSMTIEKLLDAQHENGSWGTEEDFAGDPYDQLHPTWAVMTALHSFP